MTDFVYHVYQVRLDHLPEIRLSNDHKTSLWATSDIALQKSLFTALDYVIKDYFGLPKLE